MMLLSKSNHNSRHSSNSLEGHWFSRTLHQTISDTCLSVSYTASVSLALLRETLEKCGEPCFVRIRPVCNVPYGSWGKQKLTHQNWLVTARSVLKKAPIPRTVKFTQLQHHQFQPENSKIYITLFSSDHSITKSVLMIGCLPHIAIG